MLLPLLALASLQGGQSLSKLEITSAVAVGGVSQGGRMPFGQDSVQQQIVEGTFKPPKDGDKVEAPNGRTQTWKTVTADDKGEFTGPQFNGGYAFFNLPQLEHPSIMLMCASGDTTAYVNGEPHTGDPYGYGYLKIPVKLKARDNQFLFSCGRGRLNVFLEQPASDAMLNTGDMTLPDVMENDPSELVGAVPILNCTEKDMSKLTIGASVGDGKERKLALPALMPLSVRKLAFYMTPGKLPAGDQKLHLTLYRDGKKLDEQEVPIRVRKRDQHFKNTFVSKIDGSVQYYAVAPALKPSSENALILSVHGASVEALNQAQAYKPKDWCTVVCPTNRRPYGFDWEDWGRMDGMEVWEIAKALFPHNPQRVHLTGHSMGGHGTWQLGLTYPNEFASIGPSAGWVSFWSYAGGWEPKDPTPVEAMLRRSMNQSDTLAMLENGKMEDIYILHGDKDDNVPVEQARFMRDAFAKIGKAVQYHEEPGAGHWWGDQCVDWPPMFEMFDKARLGTKTSDGALLSVLVKTSSAEPAEVTFDHEADVWALKTTNVQRFTFRPVRAATTLSIDGVPLWDSTQLPSADGAYTFERDGQGHWARTTFNGSTQNHDGWIFKTINPAVNATYEGVSIEQQIKPMEASQVTLERAPDGVNIKTNNVAMLRIDASRYSGDNLRVDEQRLQNPVIYGNSLLLSCKDGKWSTFQSRAFPPNPISPQFELPAEYSNQKHRGWAGPFKLALQNRMCFVVGTHGTPEENAWAMNKARFDAEQWYYRGNGSVPLYTDDQKLPTDRNLIIYGNSDTFSQWKRLLERSPLQVSRTAVTLDGKTFSGGDIAALWLYPHGSQMIGVIAPTGMKGARYLHRIPYFTSGVALPDWTITSAKTLKDGSKAVLGCGFFGNDWMYDAVNSAWAAKP